VAAQTGNTYISGTVIDSIEISTANLGFSTRTSSKKVSSNDCDNDRQPEIAIWPPGNETIFMIMFRGFHSVAACRSKNSSGTFLWLTVYFPLYA